MWGQQTVTQWLYFCCGLLLVHCSEAQNSAVDTTVNLTLQIQVLLLQTLWWGLEFILSGSIFLYFASHSVAMTDLFILLKCWAAAIQISQSLTYLFSSLRIHSYVGITRKRFMFVVVLLLLCCSACNFKSIVFPTISKPCAS